MHVQTFWGPTFALPNIAVQYIWMLSLVLFFFKFFYSRVSFDVLLLVLVCEIGCLRSLTCWGICNVSMGRFLYELRINVMWFRSFFLGLLFSFSMHFDIWNISLKFVLRLFSVYFCCWGHNGILYVTISHIRVNEWHVSKWPLKCIKLREICPYILRTKREE